MAVEQCENCGREIGKLQTPRVWKESVVCAACYRTPIAPDSMSPASGDDFFAAAQSELLEIPAAKVPSESERQRQIDYERMMKASGSNVGGSPAAAGRGMSRPNLGQVTSRACPSCGSTSAAVKKAKGSVLVIILLLCIGILPGLIYMIFWSGHVYVCPNCGFKYGDAT